MASLSFSSSAPATSSPLTSSSHIPRSHRTSLRHAKFQRFEQGEEEAEAQAAAFRAKENGTAFVVDDLSQGPPSDDKADDSVLPDDLAGAILHSSESTAYFVNAGGTRAIVELLLPELENLNEEGAQQRLWDLARFYLESLQKDLKVKRLKAIFPDAGAAALLKHTWSGSTFSFASLNDRRPVSKEDEVVVLVVPDYQMLAEVRKIASHLSEDTEELERPLIMWNPRLFSGDVGIGLNVRRTRDNFVSTFTVVYSMRPLSQGAIFRRYPGLWKVFLDDKERPGRYILAREQPSRPLPDDLDVLLMEGQEEEASEEPSPFAKAMGVFASFNRFMRSLSK
ncbi:hypothetical protein GOP47_0027654 [Adiantum capillus-veneris]|nr:hypothetical protein GOP47_0027654 [Adiantum capillus-veneris]